MEKAPLRSGTFAKNKQVLDDFDSSSMGRASSEQEGEVSQSAEDFEEPDEEEVHNADFRHNTGLSLGGS